MSIIKKYGDPILMVVLVAIFSFIFKYFLPLSKLNGNQILYLFSTSAQVVAGLFGFLIAGFLFFRSTLDKQVEEDESLKEIVERINGDNFIYFSTVAIMGCIGIIFSLILISIEKQIDEFVLSIFIQISVGIIFVTVLNSVSFAINLVDPDKIKKVSRKILKEINNITETIDMETFLKAYNEFERIILKIAVDPDISCSSPNRKNTKYNGLNSMLQKEIIDFSFMEDIKNIFRYRNSIVHGEKPILVDKRKYLEMEKLKDKLLKLLRLKGYSY